MWGIENPMKVFNYVYQNDDSKGFNLMVIINTDKYKTLYYTEELEGLVGKIEGLNIKDVEIKNPDNPAQLRAAKLITFSK